MQIDWLTVAAQVVNFLVLVWLLRRFLYRPVLAAMAQRKQGIADTLAAAARREDEAIRRERELAGREAQFERERGERLAALEREVVERRERLLAEARSDADAAGTRWRQNIERDREAFDKVLRDDLAAAITEAAGRCVATLTDACLDDLAFERFLDALGESDAATRQRLADADVIEVATASPVAGDEARELRWREGIDSALGGPDEALRGPAADERARLRFVHEPGLLLGAQLRVAGLRVGWNAAGLLEDARARVRERLDEVALPGGR